VWKPIAISLAVLSLSCAAPRVAAAAETVKVAVPDRGAWNTSYIELGLQQGFFQEQGLDLQIIYVADEAALENALISGSPDIAVATGFHNILAAWIKGAPVRVVSPQATGGSPRSLAQWPACKTCTARPLASPLPAR
jgi:NitT/TauT family transport system substrate-binding protein